MPETHRSVCTLNFILALIKSINISIVYTHKILIELSQKSPVRIIYRGRNYIYNICKPQAEYIFNQVLCHVKITFFTIQVTI